jgi:hypothetical protein
MKFFHKLENNFNQSQLYSIKTVELIISSRTDWHRTHIQEGLGLNLGLE